MLLLLLLLLSGCVLLLLCVAWSASNVSVTRTHSSPHTALSFVVAASAKHREVNESGLRSSSNPPMRQQRARA